MVYESRVGDVFALGATSWRIEDITHDRVLVTPAPGVPGRLPFWKGDALGRPAELGAAVGAFTRELAALPKEGRRARARTRGSTTTPPATSCPTSTSSSRPPKSCPATPRCWSSGSGRARRLAAGRPLPLRHPRARAVGAGHQRPAPRALRHRRAGGRLRRRHRDPDPRHGRRGARRRDRGLLPRRDRRPGHRGGRRLGAVRLAVPRVRRPRPPPPPPRPRPTQPAVAAASALGSAARGGEQIPVVPDRARGGRRAPPGRLRRPARARR